MITAACRCGWKGLTCLIFAFLAASAQAGNIKLSIDSSLADYVLELSCSGEPVDEDRLRNSKVLKAQIKHHSGLRDKFSMDAYIEALTAASNCETLEDDMFRFRYAVNEKEQLVQAVEYLKSREDELVAFVLAKTSPYFPADKQFSGEIVLSAAGLSCGGFSMDGAFFIDVPCVAAAIEDEFAALSIMAAHETYHAMQYVFFAPFNEDMQLVDSPPEAQDYLFMNLLTEGTAEFVADSREVPGEGNLAKLLRDFARNGYRKVNTNLRFIGYAAEIAGGKGDTSARVRDMYNLGFTGDTGQPFYYVGAQMARSIETAFGRQTLVCIMALTPEQFVLAYQAVAATADSDVVPIGPGAVRAATELGAGKPSWQDCLAES